MQELGKRLIDSGYDVNFLKRRDTIPQYIADITGHKIIVCGDSLPMHICIAYKIPCVALFTCTSPWEIEGYGILNKIVSPKLHEHYYKQPYNEEIAKSIKLETVTQAVIEKLNYEK
jgi:heptosyltransferase-2